MRRAMYMARTAMIVFMACMVVIIPLTIRLLMA